MTGPISTAQFLDIIAPAGNHYIGYTDGTLNRAGKELIKCSVFQSGQEGERRAQAKGDTNLFFTPASFKQAKIWDEKGGYLKSYRHQENVEKLKAIWLDVDFKNYPTTEAAIKGVQSFLSDFPKPTFIVHSGGGLHLYWVFEEELTPKQWDPLAKGLAAIAKARGLRADYGVTTDSARVLRLPGSRNQKYDGKPECRILHMGAYANLERMEELLRPHAAGQQRTSVNIVASENVVNLFDPAANTDLSAGYRPGLTSLMAQIAKECPTVADSLERGGEGDSYILWKDLLHLAAFCEDGEEYAFKISEGDPRFTPENTTEFFEQSVETRVTGRRGPTTCEKFSATSTKCATCQHLGRIKSPWVLGIVNEEKEQAPSFTMNGATYVTRWIENADGVKEAQSVKVVDAALDNWELIPSVDEDNPYLLRVMARMGQTVSELVFTPTVLADTKSFRTTCAKGRLGLTAKQTSTLQEVAMAWVNHLARQKEALKTASFGWSPDKKSFVLGNTLITAEEATRVANPAIPPQEFAPTGKPNAWIELTQRLLDDPDPAATYILCAAWAGPLMGILSQHTSLTVSVFSRDSGAGKTTILKAAQASFGDPTKTMSKDDTANFIAERIGMTSGLPALWDEIRGSDRAEAVTNILFSLSEGKTKGRLTSNIQFRRQHTLRTMLICGSNIPISDYVNRISASSNAAAARFIEFEVAPRPHADVTISTLVSRLDHNYGHFGPKYIREIIRNMDAYEKAEVELLDDLSKMREWPAAERFWLWGTAKILLAARIANSVGMVRVDERKLRKFALRLVDEQRKAMRDSLMTTSDIVGNMMAELANEILVTDVFRRGRGDRRPCMVLRRPMQNHVSVHIATKDKKLRICTQALRRFAGKNNISYKTTQLDLERAFKAKTIRASLGAGTEFALPASTTLEIHFDKMPNAEAIVSKWAISSENSEGDTAS